MLVKIPNTTYVRDTRTMALINTDRSGLEEYQAKAQVANSHKQEINNIKNELSDLRSSIGEIKELLVSLSRKE
jgi:hypothetical protein